MTTEKAKANKNNTCSPPSFRLVWFWCGVLGAILISVMCSSNNKHSNVGATALWILSCCIPFSDRNRLALYLRESAWQQWEQTTNNNPHDTNHAATTTTSTTSTQTLKLEIATVNMQDFSSETILPYMHKTYGTDWRTRPLLLQNLWTASDLMDDPHRSLSLQGLLSMTEDLEIDYFYNATSRAALVPNARGRVRDIVSNMTQHGLPHKIGSQRILDAHPEWITQVAPPIVTTMFGNHFQKHHLQSSFFSLLPAMTTVPVFVAPVVSTTPQNDTDSDESPFSLQRLAPPHTALHCEPIANIAVQLEGEKQWFLVSPQYSHWLRPALAPDGRAYFASHIVDTAQAQHVVPHYTVITKAGDALWVPTWTWHHVEYTTTASSSSSSSCTTATTNHDNHMVALGASLFHFRVDSFVRNNLLFAVLAIPAMVREALGWQRQ